MNGAGEMVSCFFSASQRASQPILAVCLLRDRSKSQCNIHSVHLGMPISYFSLDKSALERLSESFVLCLHLHHVYVDSFPLNLPAFSLSFLVVFFFFKYLSLLFVPSLNKWDSSSRSLSPTLRMYFFVSNHLKHLKIAALKMWQSSKYWSSSCWRKTKGTTKTISTLSIYLSGNTLSDNCAYVGKNRFVWTFTSYSEEIIYQSHLTQGSSSTNNKYSKSIFFVSKTYQHVYHIFHPTWRTLFLRQEVWCNNDFIAFSPTESFTAPSH